MEADRCRVDDYYLAEGTGLAERFTATPDGGVEHLGVLDGDGYEAWVAGLDPATGEPRGRLRQDANAVRFVEVIVNGPKTWSLAAALHPDVAAAYDAAQDRAAEQIIGWVADHATTRVGPRGRQVQVPVERIEAVTVRHYTSRAGDPHRHLHLQVNARVFADGTVAGSAHGRVPRLHRRANGIGHAAVMTDPDFRAALAAAGFTLDPATGEVAELAPYVGRSVSGPRRSAGTSTGTRPSGGPRTPARNPGRRCGGRGTGGPGKKPAPTRSSPPTAPPWSPTGGSSCTTSATADPTQPGLPLVVGAPTVGALDRDEAVETVLSRLGARRSAWNPADIRGEVEKWIAATGLVADAAVRIELAEDLTARAIAACVPLLDRPDVPEHVRALTSPQVLAVEADIVTRLAARADTPAQPAARGAGRGSGRRPAGGGRGPRREPSWWWSRVPPVPGRPPPWPPPRPRRGGRAPDGGGDPDVEGRPGRRPRGRHGRIGRLAGPSARVPVGRRRPLDPLAATPAPDAVLAVG